MKKNIVIVSGCMAVQARVKGNIQESELYHNRLHDALSRKHGLDAEYHIVTFKDLSRWLEKVTVICNDDPIDLILIQLRTHDYLNLLTFGRTGAVNETFNASDGDTGSATNSISGFYRKVKTFLTSSNNWFSTLLLKLLKSFNRHVVRNLLLLRRLALKKQAPARSTYNKVVSDGIRFASERKIPILFLGVTSRPNSYLEDHISKKLNAQLAELVGSLNEKYVDVHGMYDKDKVYKFSTGSGLQEIISLNSIGHKEVAEELLVGLEDIDFLPH